MRFDLLRIETDTDSSDEDTAYGATATDTIGRIKSINWPGVASQRTYHLRLIATVNEVSHSSSKWVDVIVGGHHLHLFTDTGSDFTIIPPELYHQDMGKVVAADTRLRAWGSNNNLDVKGMVRTSIQTIKGATTGTKIYIVDGFNPEPLPGDNDAQSLGLITFHREGRDPLPNEISLQGNIKRLSASIPEKIRKGLGISVTTNRPPSARIPDTEQTRINALIERYQGLVFDDNKDSKQSQFT